MILTLYPGNFLPQVGIVTLHDHKSKISMLARLEIMSPRKETSCNFNLFQIVFCFLSLFLVYYIRALEELHKGNHKLKPTFYSNLVISVLIYQFKE